MKNEAVRQATKEKGVYLWQIADYFGVSEMTIVRALRHELSPEMTARYLEAVDHISADRKEDDE